MAGPACQTGRLKTTDVYFLSSGGLKSEVKAFMRLDSVGYEGIVVHLSLSSQGPAGYRWLRLGEASLNLASAITVTWYFPPVYPDLSSSVF